MEQYDIVIVGAGPSGCACALALHGSGLRVALIDKENFPRDKVCGDAIPGPAFKAMDKINLVWGQAMRQFANKMETRTSRVFAPNGKTMVLNWKLYTYNSKRLDFDNFLLQLVLSNTQTSLHNKHLQQVLTDKDGVYCHFKDGTSLKTALVIGCDGANSMVRRQLHTLEDLNKPEVVAVRAYFTGVEDIKTSVNEIHFFKEFIGYFWIFPLADGYSNVGFGISRKRGNHKIPINARDTLHKIITTAPSISPRFKNAIQSEKTKGFALPIWTGKRPISGNRYLLCGDAASLIDPMQGHGIDEGMWSGLLAAQQAIKCFGCNDFSAGYMSQYDEEVYKKIGPGLSKSLAMMQAISSFPWLINAAVWLGQHQQLTQWMATKLKI